METKKIVRMTLDDIVKAKLKRENDKLTVKEIEIPSIGKSLIFSRPKDEYIFKLIDQIKEDSSTASLVKKYSEVLYMCCEELQDAELHKELEISDPMSVVPSFLDANDIIGVGDQVCSMNSLYENFDDEVKNS